MAAIMYLQGFLGVNVKEEPLAALLSMGLGSVLGLTSLSDETLRLRMILMDVQHKHIHTYMQVILIFNFILRLSTLSLSEMF